MSYAVLSWLLRHPGCIASNPNGLCLLPLAIFAAFVNTIPTIAAGQTIREVHNWIPALGIQLSFYLDGLSLVFALLISGIGALIVFYSGGYLHGDSNLGRFYMYILAFMASMLGVVLADNAITVFGTDQSELLFFNRL